MNRVTRIEEKDHIAWLVNDPLWRRSLLMALGCRATAKVETNVPKSRVTSDGHKGDIDILVWDPMNPEHATAIEAKRLRVKPETFDTGQIGGLSNLRKGVRQTNDLLRLGFHRVFLLALLQVEGWQRTGVNIAFRGTTPELLDNLPSFLRNLSAEAGLVICETMQPTLKDVRLMGGLSMRPCRDPIPRNQSLELTHRVRGQ